MGGYTKNIAVIKGLKEGFSSDGSPLTGVIKVERYGSLLHIEVTKVNFAPLTAGKYVTGITDGKSTLILEEDVFDGESDLETGEGFGALITFIQGGRISPVASAVSGNFFGEILQIKDAIEKSETGGDEAAYEDEAIAEENYYEYEETDVGGDAVRADTAQEEARAETYENEENYSPVKTTDGVKYGRQYAEDNGEKAEKFARAAAAVWGGGARADEDGYPDGLKGILSGGLARGKFYETVREEVESVLSGYPPAQDLCDVIEGSKWVKISYGGKKYYVFGVIYSEGKPAYLCYGVPSDSKTPPKSMQNMATRLPTAERAYWIMYQDADTGANIKVETE